MLGRWKVAGVVSCTCDYGCDGVRATVRGDTPPPPYVPPFLGGAVCLNVYTGKGLTETGTLAQRRC